MEQKYKEVIDANIALHTRMSADYNTCEPHFRPENVAHVESKFLTAINDISRDRMLDLGCGTGFMINIGKKYFRKIDGVDVTQAMMDRVDRSGEAEIGLHNHDTGTFAAAAASYDVVTAYSFLHHLYDIKPTLNTAYKALKPGGVFYADLDPNFYFWDSINKLDRSENYNPIVKREIEMVTYKDEDIQKNFGVDKDVFNNAEYGKNIEGGFKEEFLKSSLKEAGFSKVEIFYHWFIGQANIINDQSEDRSKRFADADMVEKSLQKVWPLSRHLFKYLGFYATK